MKAGLGRRGGGVAPIGVRRRFSSASVHVSGLAAVVAGAGLVVSAAVDMTDGRDAAVALGGLGALVIAAGLVVSRLVPLPRRVPAAAALSTVVAATLTFVGISTVAYLVTGTLGRIDDALFESTSGVTTTALTVIPDLEQVDRGVLLWRALTQWIGAFGAFTVIIAVLPFLGVGGPQATDARPPQGAHHLLSPHVRRLLLRYLALYTTLTAVGAVLFLAGGMPSFDALTYGLTTISTGGFGNHEDSFARFDSALIEWLGVAGMFVGGMSLALAWRAVRGKTASLVQSTELRVYLGLLVGGSVAVTLLTMPAGGPTHESVRDAVFTVVSVVSTTGHYVTDWGQWAWGAQALLLVFMGIGAMAGSMGGGFRIVRVIALLDYVWRELLRQLQPRSVRVIRVGRTVIDEQLVDRMIGYQVLFLLVGAVGTFGLALFGTDVLTAVAGSISALSTVGPALGDLSPGRGAQGLSHGARAVLVVVMLSGRLEIYPVLNAIEATAERLARFVRHLVGRGGAFARSRS